MRFLNIFVSKGHLISTMDSMPIAELVPKSVDEFWSDYILDTMEGDNEFEIWFSEERVR